MEKIRVNATKGQAPGIGDVTRVLQDYFAKHRDFGTMRKKFFNFHDIINNLYNVTLRNFGKTFGFDAIGIFCDYAVTALGRINWPNDPVCNDENTLLLQLQVPREAAKAMEESYSQLLNSHLTAYIMYLYEGVKSFVPTLCTQKEKHLFEPKAFKYEELEAIAIQITQDATLPSLLNVTLDLSGVRSETERSDVEAYLAAMRGLNPYTHVMGLADGSSEIRGAYIALVIFYRNLIVGAEQIQDVIFEPDINASLLGDIVKRMHDQEPETFKRKYAKSFKLITSSSELLHANMRNYYETYVVSGNPIEMTTAYLRDVAGNVGDQTDGSLNELVNHYIERARGEATKRDDKTMLATIESLRTLVNSGAKAGMAPRMNSDVRNALIRNNMMKGKAKSKEA